MNNKWGVFFLLGILLILAGVLIPWFLQRTEGILETLPFVLIGIGSGVIGTSLSQVFAMRRAIKDPLAAKLAEHERKDERNQVIHWRAKSQAYTLTIYLFGALLMWYTLVQAAPAILWPAVLVYFCMILSYWFYCTKYHKEM